MKFKKIALIVKFLLILFSYNALSQSEGPKKIADFENGVFMLRLKSLYIIMSLNNLKGITK